MQGSFARGVTIQERRIAKDLLQNIKIFTPDISIQILRIFLRRDIQCAMLRFRNCAFLLICSASGFTGILIRKKRYAPRFYKKLPQGANSESDVTAYLIEDGTVHHLEFKMNEARRYIKLRISEQLLIDFHVEYFSDRSVVVIPNSTG